MAAAEIEVTPRLGAELKDGFKPVNAWISNGINWIDDIQQFYRDRAAIEKEYSSKLYSLAKKNFEKKAKRSTGLGVGDTPSLTPGSLECASLNTWTKQLSTLESTAADHDRYSSELILQIADPLKSVAARLEELRKSHSEYASKLERERDSAYGDLKKTKGRYDGACQEVENRRKKAESSFDKSKAQTAYQQQVSEMHNVKNTYLININVANKHKERYYHEYVPELLDNLQDLSETRVTRVNDFWSRAVQLEISTLERSSDHLKRLSGEILQNDPRYDSIMFIKHNVAPWQEPMDFVFEPSPVWLDDSGMATDETAKVFLRNVLGKSKARLKELNPELQRKRKEVEGVKMVRQRIREGRDKRDEVEMVKMMFQLQEDLHQTERQRLTAEVEVQSITSTVGDVSVGAQNHQFRSETFKIPTNCDLCGERIWGLSAKGFDCQDCGYTCHSKCELRVPAECPGEQTKEERKKLKAERQAASRVAPPVHMNGSNTDSMAELPSISRSNTMDTLSSGYAASANRSVSGRAPSEEPAVEAPAQPVSKPATLRKNRIVAPPPTQYASELPADQGPSASRPTTSTPTEPRGTMTYGYQAAADGELTVEADDEVVIVEPDDGSGWTSVRCHDETGLVPTSYMEELPTPPPQPARPVQPERPTSSYSDSSASLAGSLKGAAKKKGPAVAPKRGAKKLRYVEALYDYDARSDAEWSMTEGERFVLVNKDGGDGWADVEKSGVTKSVPANYIHEI